MTGEVAHDGGEQEAGHYRIGYALEEAGRMHEWTDGELVWRDPGDENVHVEGSVRDASDGRFVPGVHETHPLLTIAEPDQPLEVGPELGSCHVVGIAAEGGIVPASVRRIQTRRSATPRPGRCK
jgi:hypothetical protein